MLQSDPHDLYETLKDQELVQRIIEKTGNFGVLIKPFTNEQFRIALKEAIDKRTKVQ
ncbi:hypothetical protein H6G06_06120 [Anabaena sphaerica FACHB-251]|uniref:Uncharacterized protein n=1 Tax=Anabaena sphaerica FACHB-251 TaxID=2692883 RepID=A0A926WEE1_9NOST|nr:hypothetical protein [Anabaena sphaerica]MBD2293071.1 hypothetical protein [Anabaena sphaerica FACHB-251]